MEMKGIDLTKCRGLYFKANIEGTPCEGKIQVEDNIVYLCQNNKVGSGCDDKMGFMYSWSIIHGTEENMARNCVEDFEIVPRDPETYKDWQVGDKVVNLNIRLAKDAAKEVIFRSGELVICKNPKNTIGGAYTCDELHRLGYRLVLTDIEEKTKYEPQDGDIIAFGYKAIGIFRNFEQSGFHSDYVTLSVDNLSFNEGGWVFDKLRPATEEEKQRLFDAMAKKGMRWNAEKKVVEDIPKPHEFKKGEPVLARNGSCEKWRICAYKRAEGTTNRVFVGESEAYYVEIVPYNERTMHLLGTAEDYKEEQL